MAKRTVSNVLTRPGGKPVVGKQISIHLNAASFTDDGQAERLRKVYATTDDTGLWSAVLDVNADLDPDGTWYTVAEDRGLIWAFTVPAGSGDLWLRDVLVDNPTNPDQLQAGVSASQLTAAITALNLGTASTHPASDFDPAGAASSAQAAATAAAASDATSKASAAQAAAISAAATDATTKANAAQSAATSAAATDATTKANAVAAQLPNYVTLARLAKDPGLLIVGAITRDSNGAATSAPVTWPDGATGAYTADTVSSAFPGAVDAYHVTYVPASGPTKTYTQPAITRDANGAATNVPTIVVT